jgi:hypothetical protein
MTTVHGMSKTPEYHVWQQIKRRCHNPREKAYCNYGGRGIECCQVWRDSFQNFITDMGRRPSSSHTIERKNNDKGYAPDNCVWATRGEQACNRRSNRIVTIDGISRPLSEWTKDIGINYSTAVYRIKQLGWEPKDALTTPVKGHQ